MKEHSVGGSYDPYFIQTEFEVIESQVILGKVVTTEFAATEPKRGAAETMRGERNTRPVADLCENERDRARERIRSRAHANLFPSR